MIADDEIVAAATRAARAWGRRHRCDWREHLGAAWEGAARAARSGSLPANPRDRWARLAAAARNGVIDAARLRTGFRRRGRAVEVPVSAFGFSVRREGVDGDGAGGWGPFEPAARPDPGCPVLALWAATRPAREAAPPRARVLLALLAVEGLSRRAAGAAVGLTENGVTQAMLAAGWRAAAPVRSRRPEGATPAPRRDAEAARLVSFFAARGNAPASIRAAAGGRNWNTAAAAAGPAGLERVGRGLWRLRPEVYAAIRNQREATE